MLLLIVVGFDVVIIVVLGLSMGLLSVLLFWLCISICNDPSATSVVVVGVSNYCCLFDLGVVRVAVSLLLLLLLTLLGSATRHLYGLNDCLAASDTGLLSWSLKPDSNWLRDNIATLIGSTRRELNWSCRLFGYNTESKRVGENGDNPK